MDKPATYYETLISKYLSGEAEAHEVSDLFTWITSDNENRKLFTSLRKSWALTMAYKVETETDLDHEWSALADHLGVSDTHASRGLRRINRRSFLRVAAILLFLIIPSAIYFLYFMSPSQGVLLADNQIIESTLPDGTQVTLNTGSTLSYPTKFKGKERKVTLEGEAFFDVSHNKDKAFIIDAESMQIKVLGTSFYVNTNSSDNTMEVVLISGSVHLSYLDKEMMLQPGDKAVVLEDQGEIVKQDHSDPNLLAWKTKKLHFNDTPFGEIVDILEKVYQKDIVVLNPHILNCRITATFDGQSLEAVLLVLKSTININVKPNGSKIEVSGEGCQ